MQVETIWRPKYFQPSELLVTSTGLSNIPNLEEWARLEEMCLKLLDPMRENLGQAVFITSAFRSEAVNKAVKGASKSQHRLGSAVDFKLSGASLDNAQKILKALEKLPYDQLIFYHPDRSSHVHISYSRTPRKEVLFANNHGGYEAYKGQSGK